MFIQIEAMATTIRKYSSTLYMEVAHAKKYGHLYKLAPKHIDANLQLHWWKLWQ